MHGVGADSQLAQSSVGFDRVQDVRRLGCAVCDELVVVAALPVGIVEVDVAHHVAAGGEDDHPGALRGGELRSEQSGEFEVPEMVRADLDFEPVGSGRTG